MADVYDTRKFHVGASCLAPQNGVCGFVTDFWLRHKFAFRFTLSTFERLGLTPARLTIPFLSAEYFARDTSSTAEGTTGTKCAEDMRCAVRATVTIPCDSPDDSGVLVTLLSGQGEGAVTSTEKLEITARSLVPPTADTGKLEITGCSLALP